MYIIGSQATVLQDKFVVLCSRIFWMILLLRKQFLQIRVMVVVLYAQQTLTL